MEFVDETGIVVSIRFPGSQSDVNRTNAVLQTKSHLQRLLDNDVLPVDDGWRKPGWPWRHHGIIFQLTDALGDAKWLEIVATSALFCVSQNTVRQRTDKEPGTSANVHSVLKENEHVGRYDRNQLRSPLA